MQNLAEGSLSAVVDSHMSKRRAFPVLCLRGVSLALAALAIYLQSLSGAGSCPPSHLAGFATFIGFSTWLSWTSVTGGRIAYLLMLGDLAALAAVGIMGGPLQQLAVVFGSAFLVATLVAVVSRSGRVTRAQGMISTVVLAALAGNLVLLVGLGGSAALIADHELTVLAWMVLLAAAVIESTVLTAWVSIDVHARATQNDRMRTLGQTLSGVTHELGTPLAALTGYADLVQGEQDEAKRDKLLTCIRDQAGRAAYVVRKLRRFIHTASREKTSSFDVHASIDAVIELYAYEARKHRVDVTFTRVPGLAPIVAERHAIEQVLVNVHRNALRELAAHEGLREIHVAVTQAGSDVEIRWQDSGPGVDPGDRRKIFDPFFSTHQEQGGMGLGLAISRGILRTNGGDLRLDDVEKGGGACFLLSMPLHEEARAVTTPKATVVEPVDLTATTGRHVLIVDDDVAYRDQLAQRLKRKGFEVSTACDVTTAEAELGSGVFDVVFLDVRLPGRSGVEFYRSLRDLTPQLSRKVIFMTGDLSNRMVVESAHEWGTPLLLKPFRRVELTDAIQEILARFPFSANKGGPHLAPAPVPMQEAEAS